MRWFLMSSSILRGGNLVVTEPGIRDGVRQVLLPLWNSWQFFATYANTADGPGGPASGYEAQDSLQSDQVLDRYLVAKTREFLDEFQSAMDCVRHLGGVRPGEQPPRHADELVRPALASPLLGQLGGSHRPSTSSPRASRRCCARDRLAPPVRDEEIWKSLTGGRSVHLADYPDAQAFPADRDLVDAMDFTHPRRVLGQALPRCASAHDLARAPAAVGPGPRHGPRVGKEFSVDHRGRLNVKSVRVLGTADAREAGFSFERSPHRERPCGGPAPGQGRAAGDPRFEDG